MSGWVGLWGRKVSQAESELQAAGLRRQRREGKGRGGRQGRQGGGGTRRRSSERGGSGEAGVGAGLRPPLYTILRQCACVCARARVCVCVCVLQVVLSSQLEGLLLRERRVVRVPRAAEVALVEPGQRTPAAAFRSSSLWKLFLQPGPRTPAALAAELAKRDFCPILGWKSGISAAARGPYLQHARETRPADPAQSDALARARPHAHSRPAG